VMDPNAITHGFLWDHGRITRIDFPRARNTGAFGINSRGQIVGDYLNPDGSVTGLGFLWNRGRFTTLKPPPPDSRTLLYICEPAAGGRCVLPLLQAPQDRHADREVHQDGLRTLP